MDFLGTTPCEYEPADEFGPAMVRLMAAFRETHDNGGALATRVRAVNVGVPDHWFRARNFAETHTNFRDLFDSSAVRSALPELQVPSPFPLADPPRFEGSWGGTLTLDGDLAATLVAGGAYQRFPGSAAEAKSLASAAVSELIQDRHGESAVFTSAYAWTPWFCDVAWDRTWVVVDHGRLEVTIACLTDSD